jgi:hypothetical protein
MTTVYGIVAIASTVSICVALATAVVMCNADRRRLDWLAAQPHSYGWIGRFKTWTFTLAPGPVCGDLRENIDMAMQEFGLPRYSDDGREFSWTGLDALEAKVLDDLYQVWVQRKALSAGTF